MPEINENKRNSGSAKKSGCRSCDCCFFPAFKKSKQEKTKHETNDLMVAIPTQQSEPPPLYSELLPGDGDLNPGTCIHIRGFVKPECSRFAVNLQCSKIPNTDIAAHINPRLSQRYVVRNSRLNGRWGIEETTSIAKFDLKRNEEFELDIFVTEKEFLVSINGKHICGFVFRIPVSRVKVLEIEGAVTVLETSVTKFQKYPLPSSKNLPYTVPYGVEKEEVSSSQLDIPVTALLSRGFKRGWQLEIYGRVKILPYAFYINLQEGAQLWPHPIVPLHLNPRFSATYGKHLFIRNAWIDGDWGPEERSPGVQFSPGASFNIAIQRVTSDHFTVWVDGQLTGEFKIRGTANKVDTVYIHGDVVINKLYMREKIDNKYWTTGQENVHSLS